MLTTLEMDGLFTEDDIKNIATVVYQCRSCKKWTRHYNHVTSHNSYVPCENCGETNYDQSSIKSLRTYNQFTDNKRKPK